MRLVLGVPFEPPVQPDAPTAREWARRELLDPVYHQQDSILQRILRWVSDELDDLQIGGLSHGSAALAIIAVVVVVVLVALWVAGPVRRARAAGDDRAVLGAADARTAAQLRAAADAAAAAADWSLAVAERFRAIVRGLEERVLLDERPGRTADEAASDGGRTLPTVAAELRTAAGIFDDVVYGARPAGPAQDEVLRRVDDAVREARAVPTTAVPA